MTRRTMLRTAYAHFFFHLGKADHDQIDRLRGFMSQLVKGWDVATVREIVDEALHLVVEPMVYHEAVDLIEQHKLAGRDIVIVSTSGAEVVNPIGGLLGADIVVATELEVVDGKYSGEIAYYAYGEEKANAVQRLADEYGYDLSACYAYSDSATDVPMLSMVGHAFVVNPDKELRRVAVENEWLVLVFSKPVGLRTTPPAAPTLAALAAGGLVAAGSAIWVARRRRAG